MKDPIDRPPLTRADKLLRDVMLGIVCGRMDYATLQAAGQYLASLGIQPTDRHIRAAEIVYSRELPGS